MLLNKDSLTILNSLQLITDSVIVNYPITSVKDSSNSITAFINLEKLGNENFGGPFCILKMREFFELIKIVGDEPNISKDEKGIITISSGDISCRYLTTAITDSIENTFGASIKILDNVKSAKEICKFELTTQVSDKLKRASTLLNFEDMVLSIKKSSIKITTTNKDSAYNNFSVDVTDNITVNGEAEVFISIRNLKRLPTANYVVTVRQHPTRAEVFVMEFIPKDSDILTLIVPSKAYNVQ